MGVFKYKDPVTKEWKKVIGGGGGGLLPQIIVSIDDPDYIITCTRNGLSLTPKTVDGKLIYDIPEYGEWSLTIQYEDIIILSESIQVDTVKQYNIYGQVAHYTMLYDGTLGDVQANLCSDITGGWSCKGYNYRAENTPYDCAYTAQGIQFRYHGYITYAGIQTPVNLTDYSGVSFYATGNIPSTGFFVSTTQYISESSSAIYKDTGSFYASGITKSGILDVSHLSDHYYIGLLTGATGFTTAALIRGVWLTKDDNWEKLCTVAGVSTPSTLSALMTNTSSLQTILANKEAVLYALLSCTGNFMTTAVTSATFLSALEASPYKVLFYANTHWSKFLSLVA